MKVTYDVSVQGPMGKIIKERMKKVKHLFPSWCGEVYVFLDLSEGEEHMLLCRPNYAYRWSEIVVKPAFFNEENWWQALIHEIQHIIIAPYINKVDSLLSHFILDETLKEYLQADFTAAEEAVVQDLAALARKLEDGE